MVFKCKMCGGTVTFDQGDTVKKRKIKIAIVASIIFVFAAILISMFTMFIPKYKLNKAMALLDSGDYEAAYALLEEIGDNDAIASSKYERAVAFIDSGDYEAAYMLLNDLDYKDSASKQKLIEKSDAWIRKCPVGSTLIFGSYEQDNNTSNGKEDIEWLVLARERDRVLVISKYALDSQQYNMNRTDVTWETCSLRKWLNETFINNAFSSDEQAMIRNTTVTADKNPFYNTNPGNNTIDKVFLLSITEANMYLSSKSAKECQPTEFAKTQGASANKYSGNCIWWLRSPGDRSDSAAYVCYDSVVEYGYSVYENYVVYGKSGICVDAVRPALWIDLGS